MQRSRRFAVALVPPIVAIGLIGCSFVDRYSRQAITFNIEAEQAQQQALLLNIVRASLRRPMQFTTVQSITGNTTAQGTAAVSAPLGPIPTIYTTALGGTVTSGPTQVTVPVLDTQEFYQGTHVSDDDNECRKFERRRVKPGIGLYRENLFVLETGVGPGPAGSPLAVDYDGTRYSIPDDRVARGWTLQVLDITKQMLAVNTSAKDLPRTNALGVISP